MQNIATMNAARNALATEIVYRFIKGQGWVPEYPKRTPRPNNFFEMELSYGCTLREDPVTIHEDIRGDRLVLTATTQDAMSYQIAVTRNYFNNEFSRHEVEFARRSLERRVRQHNEQLRQTRRG